MKHSSSLASFLEQEFSNFKNPKARLAGTVIKISDGVALVYGLDGVAFSEVVEFENGNKGMVFQIDDNVVSVVVLDKQNPVFENALVFRTKKVMQIGVSNDLIGRIIDALGNPIDELGTINPTDFVAIDKNDYGLTDRGSVNRPFETGFTAIDALIPIGKGQRELLIGDRSIGKTSVIIDTILHQKGRNVICIYVSIGSKRASCSKIIDQLAKAGALEYTIIVEADANSPLIQQYIAPYSGCAIAEFFMAQGKDVFIAYDNLSNHAMAYRSLSLLLRRLPGREAYPGDVFYVHSRLLERSCQLSAALGGGSITAMPVVETLENDLSSYISTNLISITDGQIVFDSKKFNQGIMPAINIGASVSRVGTLAQYPGMKKVQGVLKLDLAQYEDLVVLGRFGTELDKTTKQHIHRGNIAIEVLRQGRGETYSYPYQVILLTLLNNGVLDGFSSTKAKDLVTQATNFIIDGIPAIEKEIQETKTVSSELSTKICDEAKRFINYFVQTDEMA